MYRASLLALWGTITCVANAASLGPTLFDRPDLQRPLDGKNGRPDREREWQIPLALHDMLGAISTMQDNYFSLFAGTWPKAIDWTAAVMGTHISATLSSLITGVVDAKKSLKQDSCSNLLNWGNTIDKYFAQTSVFYYGENAFGLRNQAYDDMLWVVLGWLENIKFAETYAAALWKTESTSEWNWHGLQFAPLAAHRARIFYELAEQGWDEQLCNGGMVWNPVLEPYKNAITNELFTAASIAMYLYFPGDNNTSPLIATDLPFKRRHDPMHLENAVKAYRWLRGVNMTNNAGLYQDGYHITGYQKHRDGTIDPGTRKCDELDRMVYTYNQGVILSASRGLWLGTGVGSYLDDSHNLVSHVIRATGWPNRNRVWRGLGRAGVLEEYCDHKLQCSQDGQTFKGIFFLHLAEFCRPLRPQEEEMVSASENGFDQSVYENHLARCEAYGKWIEHNAKAALLTRNDEGLFGMWWGVPAGFRGEKEDLIEGSQSLPDGVEDHRNPRFGSTEDFQAKDLNDRGRGRTVETQSGGLSVLRAMWQWESVYG